MIKQKTLGFFLIGSLLTTLLFTNCSKQFASNSDADAGGLNLSSNAELNIAAESAGSPPSCAPQVAQESIKVLVASSLSGPWVENGSFCRGQETYFKLSGVKVGSAIKGCTNPSPGTGCLDLTKHREYLPSEWKSGSIVTTLSAADSLNYPVTEYSFFISLLGDKKILLEKVGAAKLVECGVKAPAPVTCSWQIINPQPVIGGGVNRYPAVACNANGITGTGYYDMGSGNTIAQSYECRCK